MLPRLLVTRLLAPVVALAGLVVAAPPAQAALTGTISAQDFTLQNNCRNQPVSYDFLIGPDTLLWQVKLSLEGPGGTASEGVDLSSVDGDPLSGTVNFLLCGSATPGTYVVHTVGSYQVLPALNLPVTVADAAFQVRPTPTRTAIGSTHLRANRHQVTARVKDRRPQGFKPTDSAEVVFERRVDGVWKRIRGSRTLTTDGLARTVLTLPAGTRVRAVTEPAGYLGGSTSRSVRLRS